MLLEVMNLVLGKRIKELRKERGLTQQQLGDNINVTKVSICCYEKGTRSPTLQTLIDLAEFFGVEITYFLGMDHYVVADSDTSYQIPMSAEEIQFIMEIRKNDRLHQQLIENPSRLLQLINKYVK